MRTLMMLAIAAALAPGPAAAASVSGDWKLEVGLGGQTILVACTLAQSDKAMSGTVAVLGVTGTFAGTRP